LADSQNDGFDAQRRDQIRAWLRTTYAQRLAWLEQAKRFAAKALAAAEKRREKRPQR
jgi:hypothetical protein